MLVRGSPVSKDVREMKARGSGIILQINYLVIFTTIYEFSRNLDGDENKTRSFKQEKRIGI